MTGSADQQRFRATFVAPAEAEHPSRDEILGALGQVADVEARSRPHVSSKTPKVIHTELGEYVVEMSAANSDAAEGIIREALAAKGAEPTDLRVELIS